MPKSPIDTLKTIMAKLRDKDHGCPWDLEQTYRSIIPHTLEETYEVIDAIEREDMPHLKEELGDLLLQVIFYAQMAQEDGHFTFDDVVTTINNKLIHRHPHVFGDATITTTAEQEASWEALKAQERPTSQSVLANIPKSLPALARALKLQKRAAKVGFDWPDITSTFAKVKEELTELEATLHHNDHTTQEELGDLLFSLVNLARKCHIDPETALRGTNQKFIKRFEYVEQTLEKQQKNISKQDLKTLDTLWEEAKKQ